MAYLITALKLMTNFQAPTYIVLRYKADRERHTQVPCFVVQLTI